MPFPLTGGDSATPIVDGWLLTSYADVVERLIARFPHIRPVDIEAVLVREHEAFTGGRPVAIPVDVEAGAEEILAAGDSRIR